MAILPSGAIERQRRYTLHSEDFQQWISCQQQISRAADMIRMFHHIPGTIPPLPASFGLGGLHRSRKVAERCILAFRQLMVFWMGFLSYLIAQTTRPEYQKPASGPLPCWYNHLIEKSFALPWLDGLVGSSVVRVRPSNSSFRSAIFFHGQRPTSASSPVVHRTPNTVLVPTHTILRGTPEKRQFPAKIDPTTGYAPKRR